MYVMCIAARASRRARGPLLPTFARGEAARRIRYSASGANVGGRAWEPQSSEAVQLLDMLSFMLKRLFAPLIAECAATGKLDQRLYVIIVAMRREWQCSVAPNEGLNSVIKRVHGRARHLSKRLLSSRLVIKGVLEKTQASKHNMTRKEEITNQKALGTSVMQTCLDVLADTKNKESHHRHALDDAIAACDRYDQPPAAELRLQDHETTPNVTDYFNLDLTEAHISMGSDLELLWRRTIVSSLGLACPCAVEIFVPAKDDTK